MGFWGYFAPAGLGGILHRMLTIKRISNEDEQVAIFIPGAISWFEIFTFDLQTCGNNSCASNCIIDHRTL
jgi:hypothetical protein